MTLSGSGVCEMSNPYRYLNNNEAEQLEELLRHSATDTLRCWILTRLEGCSASMASEGNISITLLKALDKFIMPHIEIQE